MNISVTYKIYHRSCDFSTSPAWVCSNRGMDCGARREITRKPPPLVRFFTKIRIIIFCKTGNGEYYMLKKAYCREFLLATAIMASYALIANYLGTSICMIRSIFGVPCPGCGMTTAGIALLGGNIPIAIQANAMIFAVPLVAGCMIADHLWKNPRFSKIVRWIYMATTALLVIYFITRMVLYFPNGDYPMNTSEDTVVEKICELFSR